MDVRPPTSSSAHDDDGFESLNGNGSSDSPEEDILTGSTITSQMSESTSAEQSSSTPKHNQLIEKVESNMTVLKKTADELAGKSGIAQKRCLRFKKTPLSTKTSTIDLDRRLSGILNNNFCIFKKYIFDRQVFSSLFSFSDIYLFSVCC